MGFLDFLSDEPPITGQERERCLAYLEEENRLAAFQDKEGGLSDSELVKYGTNLMSDASAAKKFRQTANRLAEADKAIVEYRTRMTAIPDAASETFFAWQFALLKNSEWASAVASAVEAAASGMTPNVGHVEKLLAEREESKLKALKCEKKLLRRLGVTGNELKNLMSRASQYVEANPWEPGQKLWAARGLPEQQDTRTIYCSKCGSKNDSQANFCRDCGTPIVVAPRLLARQRVAKSPLTVTPRAVQELKAIQAANAKDKWHVLRIDNESGGFSLWLGPEQGGDMVVGSEDTILLRASPEVNKLLEKTSVVVDYADGRLVVYPEDGPPQWQEPKAVESPQQAKPTEPMVESPKEAKPPTGIEEVCRGFYDGYIFHAVVMDIDVWSDYLDTAFKNASEADPSFAKVDRSLFWNELTAIRMEVFLLALSRMLKDDDTAVTARYVTKRYLEEMNRLDIYEIMGTYNQMLAESSTRDANGRQATGRKGEALILGLNQKRLDRDRAWMEANVKNPADMTGEEKERLECATPVWNHIGVDIRQNDCVAVKGLSYRLAFHLGYDDQKPKRKAYEWLQAAIFGFYLGAEEYLSNPDRYNRTPST